MIKPTLQIGPHFYATKNNKMLAHGQGDSSAKFVPREIDYYRGSNLGASRIKKDGTLECGRENKFTYSSDFKLSNPWGHAGLALHYGPTNNPHLIPDGEQGYDGSGDTNFILSSNTINSVHRFHLASQNSTAIQTFSIYAKALGYTWLGIGTQNGTMEAYFDLENGAIGTVESNVLDAKMSNAGNGWYRCSITVSNVNVTQINFNIALEDNNHVFNGDRNRGGTNRGGIYVMHAQWELGYLTPYMHSSGSSAARDGVLEREPLIDYSTGEAMWVSTNQRTNLITISEGATPFASQGQPAVTITQDNDEINPKGYKGGVARIQGFTARDINSDRVKAEATITPSDAHRVDDDNDPDPVYYAYTCSVFVKGTKGQKINYNAKRFGSGGDAFGTATTHTFSGEWERIDDTFVATSTDPNDPDAGNTKGGLMLVSIASGAKKSTGDEFLLWGAQVEQTQGTTSALAKDYAIVTPYIPCYGTSVTRSGCRLQTSSSNLQTDGYITSSQGTLYTDTLAVSGNAVMWHVEKQDLSEGLRIYFSTNNSVYVFHMTGGSQNNLVQIPAGDVETAGGTKTNYRQRTKIAFSWNGTDLRVGVNGAAFDSTTTPAIPAINAAIAPALDSLDRPNFNNTHVVTNELALYDKQLSLADLRTLTTI